MKSYLKAMKRHGMLPVIQVTMASVVTNDQYTLTWVWCLSDPIPSCGNVPGKVVDSFYKHNNKLHEFINNACAFDHIIAWNLRVINNIY